ncbi:hypothetical protein Q3G72_004803 [Acer saccharum]|nr:hypothetical protein Q3G72_004803 [Acer saccharum]
MTTLDFDVPMIPVGEGSNSAGPSSSSSKPKHIVVDNCAICRNHIMDLCIECQANQASTTREECTVAWDRSKRLFTYYSIRQNNDNFGLRLADDSGRRGIQQRLSLLNLAVIFSV